MEMNRQDREALEQCMEIVARDAFWKRAFEDRAKGKPDAHGGWHIKPESWEESARFASYVCQTRALNLAPWENAPMSPGIDPISKDDGSIKLRDKMLAAGVSIYHPDPLSALRKAKRCASA